MEPPPTLLSRSSPSRPGPHEAGGTLPDPGSNPSAAPSTGEFSPGEGRRPSPAPDGAWEELARALLEARTREELYRAACHLLVDRLGFSRCLIATRSEDGERLVAREGYDPGSRLPVTRALLSFFEVPLQEAADGRVLTAAWCYLEDEQVHVRDTSDYSFRPDRTYQRSKILRAMGLEEYLLTPISGPDGPLGILGADRSRADDAIGEEDRRTAGTVASLLGTALARLEEESTERRRTERSGRTDRADRAARAEERDVWEIQGVLEAMHEGLLILGPGERIRYANPAASEMLDRPPWQLVGCALDDVLPSEGRERFRELLRVDRQSVPASARRWRLDAADGTSLDVEVDVLDLPQTGAPGETAVFLEDVSQKAEAERLRDEFISMLVHDLKSPAESVVGFAELLHENRVGELNETQLDFVSRIERSGWQMIRLVEEILEVEELEAGRALTDRSEMELRPLVTDVLERLHAQAARVPVELVNGVAQDLPPVYGDRLRLEEVLQNLVDNAIEASEPGGSIRVVADRAVLEGEPFLRVDVEDEGTGLDEEARESMFEKYWSGQKLNAGDRAHTGLGLVIARLVVEAHGGKIWAESVPGQGTCVSFTVPLHPPAEGEPR